MTEWHEDDTFWEDLAPVLFNQDRLRQAAAEAGQILALLELPPGATILDLACGPGRHVLQLAGRGYRVTGVDRTAMYLEQASQKSKEQGLDVEWVRADMREFRRDDTFDAAVNLLTSFAYFADPADDRRVVENLFASLKRGGHLVMELMGKEVLARIFQRRDWHKEPDGALLLEERTVCHDWTWLDVRWTLIGGQQQWEHRFGHRLYSAAELGALLASVGFVDVRARGSLQGAPYDHEAQRLVMLARKPGTS